MTPSNLEKIFGPDVEDPIDIDNDPVDVDMMVVGLHNNLVIEQAKMVMTSGCGRYEGAARSYQDKMFVTLSFSDPELSASQFASPQPKRVQSAPLLQARWAESQSAIAIQSKIENCLSRSRSEDNVGSFHCEAGCEPEMSEESSYFQNDETNVSDFTSVFTNETEPDLPTLLPGQIEEKEEEEEDLDEETNGAIMNEKTAKDHNKYKTRKRTWWKQICLLCMSKQ